MPRSPRTATGQFRPGVSGNPNGRPPTRRDSATDTALVATSTAPLSRSRRDGWINSETGHGTRRDRRRLTQYGVDIVTDIEAQQLWRSEFLAAAIIEQGPREAFSRGWHLKCEDKELAEEIAEDVKRIGATRAVVDAAMYENALGGAAIFPVLSGSLGDLSEPLDERGIASVDALHVFEPQELTPVQWYSDIRQPKFRKPMTYRLIPLTVGRAGFVSTVEIHESRLIILPGTQVSVQTQPGQRLGWGDSQLCRPWSVISDFGLAWGSAATLLHNHGKETLEMDGFANIMAQSDGVQEFDRYLDAMWSAWSTLRMNVIDRKSQISRATGTLAGVSDLLNEFKVLMAAAARRPVSVLMGQSQSGLRTGDDDTRTWYKTVESDRADRWHYPLERIVQLLLLATTGPTSGKMPGLWSIEYPALWAPTEKEVAETRKTDADRAGVLIDKGVVSADDVAESFFKGDTYSGDIHVNWERREAQAKIAQQGVGDLSPEDQAAMGRGGEEQEDLSDDEQAELDRLREEFGTEDGDGTEDDDEEDLEDLEEEPEEEPEEDDEDREDSAWREDQVGVSTSGHGYNPYRDKGGKFAPGAHKEKPTAGERHAAAVARASERVGKAKARVEHHEAKTDAAYAAKHQALQETRAHLERAKAAAELARAKPTAKNIKAAQVATNKATRAQAKVDKHEAAIRKHIDAHAKATTAHAKAVEGHAKASARASGVKTRPDLNKQGSAQKSQEANKASHTADLATAHAKETGSHADHLTAAVAHDQAAAAHKEAGSPFAVDHSKQAAEHRATAKELARDSREANSSKPSAEKHPLLWHDAIQISDRAAKGDFAGVHHELDRKLSAMGLQRTKPEYENNRGRVVTKSDADMPGANGTRGWDGEIRLRQSQADKMQAFGALTGGRPVHEILASDRKRHAELDKQAEKAYANIVRAKSGAKKNSAREEYNRIHKERHEIASRETQIVNSSDGMRTMVHETMHGFSPGTVLSYHKHGAQIEEITTEVGARVVMHQTFGVDMVHHTKGAYSEEIHAATKAISHLTGKSESEAYLHLQEASMEHKKRPGRSLHNADEVTSAFAHDIARSVKLPASQVEAVLRQHLNEVIFR